MLKKELVIDQIEVIRNGTIQVRRANLIIENGIEIAKTYHRHALSPGDDLAGQAERVAAVARAVWTPEVIEAHQEFIRKSMINKID